mgnify:CR=1 FL=1|jgi:hypothetical protein
MLSGDQTGVGLLALASLAGAFGNAINPISILAWIHPVSPALPPQADAAAARCSADAPTRQVLSLAAFQRLVQAEGRARGMALFAAGQTLGFVVAFASLFPFPASHGGLPASILGVAVFGTVFWLLWTVLVFLPNHLLSARFPSGPTRVLVFPVLHTACTLLLPEPFVGTFGSSANAVLDADSVRQLVALGGLPLVNLAVHAPAAALFAAAQVLFGLDEAASARAAARQRRFLRSAVLPVLAALLAALVAGGLLAQRGVFFQQDIARGAPPETVRAPPCPAAPRASPRRTDAPPMRGPNCTNALAACRQVGAACVLAQNEAAGSAAWARVMKETDARLAAGDEVVLWSEAALKVRAPPSPRSPSAARTVRGSDRKGKGVST